MNLIIPLAAGAGAWLLFRGATAAPPAGGVDNSGAAGPPEPGPNGPSSPEVIQGPIAAEGASARVPGLGQLDLTALTKDNPRDLPKKKPPIYQTIGGGRGTTPTGGIRSCVSCPSSPKAAGLHGGQHPDATDSFIGNARSMHPLAY